MLRDKRAPAALFLPKEAHQAAERSARARLRALGFEVRSAHGSVTVSSAGFSVRVRAARLILPDLDPTE